MKTLASRVAALEKKQKQVISDSGYREQRFIGRDGQPWVRYSDRVFSIELPCNGRDDPLQVIAQQVESGAEKPDGLVPEESEAWDVELMGKLGKQIIRRILAGEVMPEDLTPNERDCWELVEAVREKY